MPVEDRSWLLGSLLACSGALDAALDGKSVLFCSSVNVYHQMI